MVDSMKNHVYRINFIKHFNIITITVMFIWTILIFGSAYFGLKTNNLHNEALLKKEAETNLKKDLLYRRWCSLQGGVYAPISEQTFPNPYLDSPERDIETSSGKKLTLINPSYMTRMVYELSQKDGGFIGHMTSLNPIRPQNRPDDWERNALMLFEQGVKDYSSYEEINGELYLRLMKPFTTEKSCLKCHEKQGYKEGDIRGGLSVAIPVSYYTELSGNQKTSVITRHGIIWFVISLGIYFTSRYLKSNIIANKESEQRFKLLGESTFEGIVFLKNGKIFDLNDQLTYLLGYRKDEILGRSILDFVHKDSLDLVIKSVESNNQNPMEVQLVRNEGTFFYAEVLPRMMKIGSDNIRITAVRDITERKKNEESLKESRSQLIQMNQNLEQLVKERTIKLLESEEKTRLILDNAPESIYGLDLDGKCTMVNRAFLELMKYENETEVIGRNMHELIHHSKSDGSKFPPSDCPIYSAIRSGDDIHLDEAIFWKKDNTSIPVEFWSTMIKKDGITVGSVTSFIDITQRKIAAEQLRKAKEDAENANRAKSEFLANISHEIRTPMNAIMGYSEILEGKITDADQIEHVKSIITNGNALLSLINDIIDISRIESGNIEINSEYIAFRNILLDVKMKYLPKAKNKDLEFIIDIKKDFPHDLYIDGNRMRRVISNLVDNALKFTEKGLVKIHTNYKYHSLENDEAEINIIIEDTGIGIEQNQLEKIFSPFVQADGKSNRKYGGTGIGLAISIRFVKLMGGNIFVESTVGKGSKFKISFANMKVRKGSEEEHGILNLSETIVETLKPEIEEMVLSLDKLLEFNNVLNKYYKEWEILNKSRQMTAVKDFANRLNITSKEYGSKELANYSDELLESANSLKVVRIKDLLSKYPKIIETITQNKRGNL